MFATNNNPKVELLVQSVDSYIAEFKKTEIHKDSDEWYLLNNLTDFRQLLITAKSKQDIKNASKILSRFCVESFNWDTNNFKKCVALSEEGFAVAKYFVSEATHSI